MENGNGGEMTREDDAEFNFDHLLAILRRITLGLTPANQKLLIRYHSLGFTGSLQTHSDKGECYELGG